MAYKYAKKNSSKSSGNRFPMTRFNSASGKTKVEKFVVTVTTKKLVAAKRKRK